MPSNRDIEPGSRMDANANLRSDTFDHYGSTSVYLEGYEADDEVFVDTTGILEEEISERAMGGRIEPRVRRISDVIDSVGESSPSRHMSSSPPATPGGSDLGYYSTGTPPPHLTHLTFTRSNHHHHFSFGSSSIEPPSPTKWDTVDAQPYVGSWTGLEVQKSVMPVERDSDQYNMDHPRRGVALIFNHIEFNDKSLSPRTGSEVDVNRLTQVLQMLHFEVKVHTNLKCTQITNEIEELAKSDHTDCDCVVVVVLTHGKMNNCLHAYDYIYQAETLWQPFTGDKCLTLAGKPKIFIIQACRGESRDGGVRLVSSTQHDSAATSYKIPSMADFFIAYGTAEGYYSLRDPENGTWFIQSLCRVLSDNYKEMDLQRMMTRVSRHVAINFESHNDVLIEHHQLKQVPNMHSTLIRDVYFRPKQ